MRGKTGRAIGRLDRLAGHDEGAAERVQQGPAGGQGSGVRRRSHAGRRRCARRTRWCRSSPSTRDRTGRAASGLLLATDVADYLASRGMPFRRAHEVVGAMVRRLLAEGRDFSDLTLEEWRAASDMFGERCAAGGHGAGLGGGPPDARSPPILTRSGGARGMPAVDRDHAGSRPVTPVAAVRLWDLGTDSVTLQDLRSSYHPSQLKGIGPGEFMQQRRLRLGDILDDYCPRERRITNHVVVAMIEDEVKQTRCTTCDAEHEYKQAQGARRSPPQDGRAIAVGARTRPTGRSLRAVTGRGRPRRRSAARRRDCRSRPRMTFVDNLETPLEAADGGTPRTPRAASTTTARCIGRSFARRCRVPRGRRRSARRRTSRCASRVVASTRSGTASDTWPAIAPRQPQGQCQRTARPVRRSPRHGAGRGRPRSGQRSGNTAGQPAERPAGPQPRSAPGCAVGRPAASAAGKFGSADRSGASAPPPRGFSTLDARIPDLVRSDPISP